MRTVALLVVCLVAGCTLGDPPIEPPVAPMPDDLSTWSVPELVSDPGPPVPLPTMAQSEDPKPTPAEKVYLYAPGGTYVAPVPVGSPLDIVFGRGEQLHNITDGDRAPQGEGQSRRWEVRQGVDGTGDSQRHHVFVTVTEPGLKNGLVITTTAARTYYITLQSVNQSPIRVLRWKYPHSPVEVTSVEPTPVGPLPPLDKPARYHVGYQIESIGHRPSWVPSSILDDGKKMFVILPITTLHSTAPLLRKIGPNGPSLVNSQHFLNVLIVDELAARLELRIGTGDAAEVVRITRGNLRTIQCPGVPECPVWPAAARTLARRQP